LNIFEQRCLLCTEIESVLVTCTEWCVSSKPRFFFARCAAIPRSTAVILPPTVVLYLCSSRPAQHLGVGGWMRYFPASALPKLFAGLHSSALRGREDGQRIVSCVHHAWCRLIDTFGAALVTKLSFDLIGNYWIGPGAVLVLAQNCSDGLIVFGSHFGVTTSFKILQVWKLSSFAPKSHRKRFFLLVVALLLMYVFECQNASLIEPPPRWFTASG